MIPVDEAGRIMAGIRAEWVRWRTFDAAWAAANDGTRLGTQRRHNYEDAMFRPSRDPYAELHQAAEESRSAGGQISLL